jgi:BioD-like phosphotransacetylase family protein
MIQELPFPVLLSKEDSYEVASVVHDLTVKTRPIDTEKITVIRDLIAKYVDVDQILKRL